jgi:hypothetical protein
MDENIICGSAQEYDSQSDLLIVLFREFWLYEDNSGQARTSFFI